MLFAHPLALWLLAATPLPVVLHLLGRARPREMVFPGAFLLRQMEAQRRSLRLRHLLLLALRMAAVALAALALAGPYAAFRLPLLGRSRPPLVLLDTSAGMKSGAAWRQAHEVATSFLAANPGAKVLTVPSSAPGVPDEPSSGQAALADEARKAFESGLLAPDQVLAVISNLEEASVLPRRWPPGMPPVRKFVVACDAPAPGLYSAWAEPTDPPALAPTRLRFRLAPSADMRTLRVLDRGKPLAATEVPMKATAAGVALGRFSTGDRSLTIDARPAQSYRLGLNVTAPVRIGVVAPADAARYLRAAVDPAGQGKPFALTTSKPDALVLCGEPRVTAGQPSAIIFARPPAGEKPLPPEQAESLLFAADVPPPLEDFVRDFRPILERARILKPVSLSPPDATWQVVARFANGTPAMLWSEDASRRTIMLGFAPLPDSTDLVSSGAFAAMVQALLLTVLTPHAEPSDPNSPPACLAGTTVSAEALKTAWGRGTEVVPYRPGLTLPSAPPVTDLTSLLALLIVGILAAEGILSAALSSPSSAPQ